MALFDSMGGSTPFSDDATRALTGASSSKYLGDMAKAAIETIGQREAAREYAKAYKSQQRQSGGGFLGGLGSFLGAAAPIASLIPGIGPAAAVGAVGAGFVGNAMKKSA